MVKPSIRVENVRVGNKTLLHVVEDEVAGHEHYNRRPLHLHTIAKIYQY